MIPQAGHDTQPVPIQGLPPFPLLLVELTPPGTYAVSSYLNSVKHGDTVKVNLARGGLAVDVAFVRSVSSFMGSRDVCAGATSVDGCCLLIEGTLSTESGGLLGVRGDEKMGGFAGGRTLASL